MSVDEGGRRGMEVESVVTGGEEIWAEELMKGIEAVSHIKHLHVRQSESFEFAFT